MLTTRGTCYRCGRTLSEPPTAAPEQDSAERLAERELERQLGAQLAKTSFLFVLAVISVSVAIYMVLRLVGEILG